MNMIDKVIRVSQQDSIDRLNALLDQRDLELQRLRSEVEALVEAWRSMEHDVRKLSFQMPAPNSYTPRFMQLCVSVEPTIAAITASRGEGK